MYNLITVYRRDWNSRWAIDFIRKKDCLFYSVWVSNILNVIQNEWVFNAHRFPIRLNATLYAYSDEYN